MADRCRTIWEQAVIRWAEHVVETRGDATALPGLLAAVKAGIADEGALETALALGGEAGLGFVHRVVDDFEAHVVQAGAVIGVADIHARPLAHGVEPLQHPDRFRTIFNRNGMLSVGRCLPGRFCHVRPSRVSRISRAK